MPPSIWAESRAATVFRRLYLARILWRNSVFEGPTLRAPLGTGSEVNELVAGAESDDAAVPTLAGAGRVPAGIPVPLLLIEPVNPPTRCSPSGTPAPGAG